MSLGPTARDCASVRVWSRRRRPLGEVVDAETVRVGGIVLGGVVEEHLVRAVRHAGGVRQDVGVEGGGEGRTPASNASARRAAAGTPPRTNNTTPRALASSSARPDRDASQRGRGGSASNRRFARAPARATPGAGKSAGETRRSASPSRDAARGVSSDTTVAHSTAFGAREGSMARGTPMAGREASARFRMGASQEIRNAFRPSTGLKFLGSASERRRPHETFLAALATAAALFAGTSARELRRALHPTHRARDVHTAAVEMARGSTPKSASKAQARGRARGVDGRRG